MSNKCEFSIPELVSLFKVDDMSPTGLSWLRHRMKSKIGTKAGYMDSNGYWHVEIFGRSIRVHRIVWAITHGKYPDGDIDHINGIRSDNRISNLRDVSRSVNSRNAKISKNNTSGVNGVSFCKRSGKWQAYIRGGVNMKHLGYFRTIEEASEARSMAEMNVGGFTRRHGRSK